MDSSHERLVTALTSHLGRLSYSDQVVGYVRAALFYRLLSLVTSDDAAKQSCLPRPVILLVSDLLSNFKAVYDCGPEVKPSGNAESSVVKGTFRRLTRDELAETLAWFCPQLADVDAVWNRYVSSGESLCLSLLALITHVKSVNDGDADGIEVNMEKSPVNASPESSVPYSSYKRQNVTKTDVSTQTCTITCRQATQTIGASTLPGFTPSVASKCKHDSSELSPPECKNKTNKTGGVGSSGESTGLNQMPASSRGVFTDDHTKSRCFDAKSNEFICQSSSSTHLQFSGVAHRTGKHCHSLHTSASCRPQSQHVQTSANASLQDTKTKCTNANGTATSSTYPELRHYSSNGVPIASSVLNATSDTIGTQNVETRLLHETTPIANGICDIERSYSSPKNLPSNHPSHRPRVFDTLVSVINDKDCTIRRLEQQLASLQGREVKRFAVESERSVECVEIIDHDNDYMRAVSRECRNDCDCGPVISRQKAILKKLARYSINLEQQLRLIMPTLSESASGARHKQLAEKQLTSKSVEIQVDLLSTADSASILDNFAHNHHSARSRADVNFQQSTNKMPVNFTVLDAARMRISRLWAASSEIDQQILSLQINQSVPASVRLAKGQMLNFDAHRNAPHLEMNASSPEIH